MELAYFKQKKILLVDDEKEILNMVSSFFREDGFSEIRTGETIAHVTYVRSPV